MKNAVKLAVIIASAGPLSGVARAQNVINGGFDGGNASSSMITGGVPEPWIFPADAGSPDTWIPNVTNADLANGMMASPDGGQFVAGAGGGIVNFFGSTFDYYEFFDQRVTGFTIGQQYELSFYQANAGIMYKADEDQDGHWSVGFFSQLKESESMEFLGEGNQVWQKQTFTFIADATRSVLRFTPVPRDDADPDAETYMALDGVTITPVPEPSALACLGLVAGCAVWRRRR